MIRIFDTGGRWFMAVTRDDVPSSGTGSNRIAFPLDYVEGFYSDAIGYCYVNWINPAKPPTKLMETYTEVIDAIAAYDASKS